MTDKVVHFTKDGYAASGGGGTNTFTIPLTTGKLSETNATYMFEINLVGHSAQRTSFFGVKACYSVQKTGSDLDGPGTVNPTIVWQTTGIGYQPTITCENASGDLLFTIVFAAGHTGFYWRAFVDVYVKDASN